MDRSEDLRKKSAKAPPMKRADQNTDNQPSDRETDAAERKTPARQSRLEQRPSLASTSIVSNAVIQSSEEDVRRRAERAALAASLESPLQLDEIWQRDLNSIDLPEYVKLHNTTISFPEKLMLMLIHIERNLAKSGQDSTKAPIRWALDGRAFVIREREQLVKYWLPVFFRHGKFQSFTRKLYRWGFRQVNLPQDNQQGKDRDLVFANPHFQRDHRELMTHMRSITAAGLRRQQQQNASTNAGRAAPGTALTTTPRASDSLIQSSLGMPLLQAAVASMLPALNPFPLAGQQQQQQQQQHLNLNLIDSLSRQLLINGQLMQFPSIGFLPLNPHMQQQLLLSSLLNAAHNQASINRLLLPPLAMQPLGGEQGLLGNSSEQKEGQEGTEMNSQERLLRAAEVLFGAFPRGRQDPSPSEGKESEGS